MSRGGKAPCSRNQGVPTALRNTASSRRGSRHTEDLICSVVIRVVDAQVFVWASVALEGVAREEVLLVLSSRCSLCPVSAGLSDLRGWHSGLLAPRPVGSVWFHSFYSQRLWSTALTRCGADGGHQGSPEK